MPAYSDMDERISGLKQGICNRVASRIAAKNIRAGGPAFAYEKDEDLCYPFLEDTGVVTWAGDFATGNSIAITVAIDGAAPIDVTAVAFDTDQATTMNALISQIEADVEGAEASGTDTTNNRVLEIFVQGSNVVVTATVTGGTAPTNTITYDTAGVFLGVAMFTNKESAARQTLAGDVIEDTEGYIDGERVSIMINGWISVEVGEAVDAQTPAYILTSGDGKGKFGGTASGNISTDSAFTINAAANGFADIRINK